MITDDIARQFRNNKDIQAIFIVGSGTEKELCAVLKKADKRHKAKISASLLEIAKHYPETVHLSVTDNDEINKNPHFLVKMLRQGRIIVGEMPDVTIRQLGIEPFVILSYDLRTLDQKGKMQLKRVLYGKKTAKKYKDKTYISEKKGIIERIGGKRVGRAVLLLNQNSAEEIEYLLKQRNIPVTKTNVWAGK